MSKFGRKTYEYLKETFFNCSVAEQHHFDAAPDTAIKMMDAAAAPSNWLGARLCS
jgi:hypothetical protein